MNMMTRNDWCQLAWQVVARFPGTALSALRAQWDAHAEREEVMVTLFGPYDSGKSSLLKRLLVDEGGAVPNWLTISARPETFEASEIKILGVTICDTPGIAGGNEQHALVANDALALSDMIVLVLPPQMVTSGEGAFASVLAGDHFCCNANVAYAERGLAVMLNRMDEAGVSPDDDPEGYVSLRNRKAHEFDKLLRKAGGAGDVVTLFMGAADPYSLVGNRSPVERSDYDVGRSWDGIESFTGFLRGLARRKHELRRHAETRFLGAALGQAAKALRALSQERSTAIETAKGESEMHALSRRRLAALLDSAKTDLDRCISEEVAAAARRGGVDSKELRQVVSSRLEAALDRWVVKHDAEIDTLLQDVDCDLKGRRERPSSKLLWSSLDEDEGEAAESRDEKKGSGVTVGWAKKFVATLHKGFREIHAARFGMTVQKSREELNRLGRAPSFAEYVKETGKKAIRFQDEKQAGSAKWSMHMDAGLQAVVPAIIELGGLVVDARSEQRRAEEQTRRRTEATQAVESFAKKLAADAWAWWCDEGVPAAAKEGLQAAQDAADEVKNALAADVDGIKVVLGEIEDCLARLRLLGVRAADAIAAD